MAGEEEPKKYNRVGSVQLWDAYEEIAPNDFGSAIKTESGKILKITPGLRAYWRNATRGLDFKFHYETASTAYQGLVGKGSVSILGLNGDTVRSLVSYATPDENKKKRKFITVYAGYENDNAEDFYNGAGLFTMRYIGADMTPPPDMWLTFKSEQSNAILNDEFVSGSVVVTDPNGYTVKEVCSQTASALGMSLDWRVDQFIEERLPKVVGLDYSAGTIADAVREINEWGLVNASIEVAVGGNTGRYVLVVRDKPEFWKDETPKPKIISASNGMVGLPSYGPSSKVSGGGMVTVKTLLRRDIRIGDAILVKSTYIQPLFPWYRVNKISYDGHFRGQEWYSTFSAIYTPPGQDEKTLYLKQKKEKERAEIEKAIREGRMA